MEAKAMEHQASKAEVSVRELRAAVRSLDSMTSGVRTGLVLVSAAALAQVLDHVSETLAGEQDWDRVQMPLPDYVKKWGAGL